MKKGTVGFILSIIGVSIAGLGTSIGSVVIKNYVVFLVLTIIVALIINVLAFVLCNSEMKKNNNKGIVKAGFIISIIGLSACLAEILLLLFAFVLIMLFAASFSGSSL